MKVFWNTLILENDDLRHVYDLRVFWNMYNCTLFLGNDDLRHEHDVRVFCRILILEYDDHCTMGMM